MSNKVISFIAGFVVLFGIYHLPEFFPAFWLMAVCKIGFLIVAFLLARWQGWSGLDGYGLGLKRGWWQNLLKGLTAGIVFFAFSQILSVMFGYDRITGVETAQRILQQLPMILLMTVFPSVDEDILTRGYLFGHLQKYIKPGLWIFLSASVFTLNHIWRLNEHPAVLIYLFLLGLVLAIAVWQTGNLWLAFGIHWGSNIAFESTNSFIHSESSAVHHETTWILAGCWLLLVIIFSFRSSLRKESM